MSQSASVVAEPFTAMSLPNTSRIRCGCAWPSRLAQDATSRTRRGCVWPGGSSCEQDALQLRPSHARGLALTVCVCLCGTQWMCRSALSQGCCVLARWSVGSPWRGNLCPQVRLRLLWGWCKGWVRGSGHRGLDHACTLLRVLRCRCGYGVLWM